MNGHAPTQIFYHFEADQAVIRVIIHDNALTATAVVYLFSYTRSVDAIEKWISNQHEDYRQVAPNPVYEYQLSTNQFSISRGSFIGSRTDWRDIPTPLDLYRVSIDIQGVIDGDIFELEPFTDETVASVRSESVTVN